MLYVLVPLTVCTLTPLCFALIRKSNVATERKMSLYCFKIRVSVGLCWFMLFFTILVTFAWILLNLNGSLDTIDNLICLPIYLLIYLGCYVCIREELTVTGNKIVYTPIFSRKRNYTWSDIGKIKVQYDSKAGVSYIVYDRNNRKMFTLSDSIAGTKLFLARAKKENISCIR